MRALTSCRLDESPDQSLHCRSIAASHQHRAQVFREMLQWPKAAWAQDEDNLGSLSSKKNCPLRVAATGKAASIGPSKKKCEEARNGGQPEPKREMEVKARWGQGQVDATALRRASKRQEAALAARKAVAARRAVRREQGKRCGRGKGERA